MKFITESQLRSTKRHLTPRASLAKGIKGNPVGVHIVDNFDNSIIRSKKPVVIPAKAGIHGAVTSLYYDNMGRAWMPASAGMTVDVSLINSLVLDFINNLNPAGVTLHSLGCEPQGSTIKGA